MNIEEALDESDIDAGGLGDGAGGQVACGDNVAELSAEGMSVRGPVSVSLSLAVDYGDPASSRIDSQVQQVDQLLAAREDRGGIHRRGRQGLQGATQGSQAGMIRLFLMQSIASGAHARDNSTRRMGLDVNYLIIDIDDFMKSIVTKKESSVMATEAPGQSNEQKRLLPFRSHVAIALLFGLLVILYTAGVVLGFVGEGRKIDAVNLALIALAVLWAILLLRPEVFARVQRFEMTGFKLEMRTVVEQLDERITNFLVSSMSADIFHRLCGIAILIKYEYQHKYFEREMYWLKDNGFIKTKPPNTDREFYGGIDGKNLAEMWEPTEVGWFAVRLRKKEIPPDLLKDPINLKIDPSTL